MGEVFNWVRPVRLLGSQKRPTFVVTMALHDSELGDDVGANVTVGELVRGDTVGADVAGL